MEQDWLRERSRTLRERLDRRLEEADALRREWNRSPPGEFRRNRHVHVKPDPLSPKDSERH